MTEVAALLSAAAAFRDEAAPARRPATGAPPRAAGGAAATCAAGRAPARSAPVQQRCVPGMRPAAAPARPGPDLTSGGSRLAPAGAADGGGRAAAAAAAPSGGRAVAAAAGAPVRWSLGEQLAELDQALRASSLCGAAAAAAAAPPPAPGAPPPTVLDARRADGAPRAAAADAAAGAWEPWPSSALPVPWAGLAQPTRLPTAPARIGGAGCGGAALVAPVGSPGALRGSLQAEDAATPLGAGLRFGAWLDASLLPVPGLGERQAGSGAASGDGSAARARRQQQPCGAPPRAAAAPGNPFARPPPCAAGAPDASFAPRPPGVSAPGQGNPFSTGLRGGCGTGAVAAREG
jgi:hypothetical protein